MIENGGLVAETRFLLSYKKREALHYKRHLFCSEIIQGCKWPKKPQRAMKSQARSLAVDLGALCEADGKPAQESLSRSPSSSFACSNAIDPVKCATAPRIQCRRVQVLAPHKNMMD